MLLVDCSDWIKLVKEFRLIAKEIPNRAGEDENFLKIFLENSRRYHLIQLLGGIPVKFSNMSLTKILLKQFFVLERKFCQDFMEMS